MSLDTDTVTRIARLARIKVTDEETETLAGELSAILTWVEQLSEVDTSSVEPMTSGLGMTQRMRADEITDGDQVDKVTANAPEAAHGFFTVPKVVE
ncbi:MAG: Asp-tRNA(Asn)/Glu-tRNA(Gln) amidotransferase subunit GatC [Pseudomonadota bacterium]